MQLRDILRALRNGWRLILAMTLLGILLAAGTTLLMPKTYEATSQLFVSTASGKEDSNQLLQGSSFTQQRVKSYAEAITSPYILDDVITDLGLSTTPEVLGAQIMTEIPLETVLIDVTSQADSPQGAADIANAVSREFSEKVPTLESSEEGQSPVKVTLIRDAVPPIVPVSPQPLLNLILGFLLGLAGGTALALLRQSLDTTVKTEADVKEVTNEVIIGGIHFAKESKSKPLITDGDPHSPRAESFRALRTNLQFVDVAHPAKSLVLTSSIPGEGKSTTTANLALAMGESGARVCVVEADLRRPRMIEYMGLASGAGLTNLIIGDVDYEDVLQPFGKTNVVCLGAGPIPPNPSELLGSPAMGEIIRELEGSFDYVLYDAPPLLPVTDAAVLSRRTGGTIVVVGSGVVRIDQVKKTLEILNNVGAQVLGLVMNRLPAKGPDAYSYSYYGEGYQTDPVHDPNAPRTSRKRQRQVIGKR